ncbi:hypothetical protein N9D38_07480 [Rubripirellula sp.]|nr:hypothetical protein [Rubripirellula sp.]
MIRLTYLVMIATSVSVLQQVVRAQELPIPIEEVQTDAEIIFSESIMPILKRNCLACHHEKEAEGGLILETIESIHKGGDSGSSLNIDSPAMSLLLTRTTGEEEPLMPPEDNAVGAKSLTPQELGLIKRWIEQGAKGSEMLAEKIEWQEIPESIRTSFAVAIAPTNRFAVVGRGNRTHIIPLQAESDESANPTEFAHLVDPNVPGQNAAHVDLVQSVAISPDGHRIATGGFRTVKLWSQRPNPLSAKAEKLLTASGLIAINSDQSIAAWVNPLGDIEVWNVNENRLVQTFTDHANPVTALAWTGPSSLLSGDTSGRIVVWNPNDGNFQQEIQSGISIRSVAIAQNGTDLAIISIQGLAHRGKISTEDQTITIESDAIPSITGATNAAFFNAEPPQLVICDSTQNVSIIDQGNQTIRKIDHGSPVNVIHVSNSAKQLFTGGMDGTTRSWNLGSGEPIHTFQSDSDQQLLVAYAERDNNRQTLKVDRLTKQTEELDKRLQSENEVLAKVTEEQTKAQTALGKKEKARADAAALIATTENAIKQSQEAITMAEKTTADAQKNLTESTAKTETLTKELESENTQLKTANEEVEKLKAEIAAMTEKLQQTEKNAATIQKKVDDKKTALEQTKQIATNAQMQIDAAAKVMVDSKAAIEKDSKALETQKTNLNKAEEEKGKSEAELAKRQQAFETAKEAQKRAESAIPVHKAVIESESREKERLEQELASVKANLVGSSQRVTAIAVNDSNQWLATTHFDQSVRVYDAKTGQPLMSFPAEINQANTQPNELCWIDSELIVFGNNQKTQAWSSQQQWELERTIGSPNDASLLSDRITAMDFRKDGLSLAIGSGSPSRAGEVKVFSVETGELIRDFGEIHSDSVLGLRFSPRGNLIASSAADKTVRLLDISSGQVKRSLEGHTHHVLAIAWQDDEQTLASASADKTIKIWDIETGEQRRTITGFGKEITALNYVAASNQLATACADGQARLYDTSNGKSLRSFNANGDFLYSLATSLDGKQLLSSGQSGTLRLWNIEDGKLIHEWK